jgi:hypothetical protein
MTRTGLRQDARQVVDTAFKSRAGQVIEPRFCKLDSAVVGRPLGDKLVDDGIWRVADEQVIPPETRAKLEANGLRVGLISGSLPGEVLEAFHPPAPQREVEWVHVVIPEGDHTPIVPGATSESVTILLNHAGRVEGRDFKDAQGRLNITAHQQGAWGISLRLVPEVVHGPIHRSIAPLANAGQFAQKEFMIRDGQQEDVLRELAATIDVQPGQFLVLGCRSTQPRSLGSFLFTQAEPNSDRLIQSILILQASRNNGGSIPPPRPDDTPDPGALRAKRD